MFSPEKFPFPPCTEGPLLATPTMHGEELDYIRLAYDTNWMSTVGENINEVERIAAAQAEVGYAVGLACCTAAAAPVRGSGSTASLPSATALLRGGVCSART